MRKQPDPDPNAVLEALRRMEQVVGQPREDLLKSRDSLLPGATAGVTEELVKTWNEKLAEMVLSLIEKPDFRLAGSEEALRQLSDTVGKVLEHNEVLCRDLAEQASNAHMRVQSLADALRANPNNPRRNAPIVTELIEVLRQFPRQRYQALLLRRVTDVYVSVRGQLSEQMREVNFCRQRLGELVRIFEETASAARSSDPVPGMCLLPSGCRSLDDAIQRLLDTLAQRATCATSISACKEPSRKSSRRWSTSVWLRRTWSPTWPWPCSRRPKASWAIGWSAPASSRCS